MSNHVGQKAINLHHKQQAAAGIRRLQQAESRRLAFIDGRHQVKTRLAAEARAFEFAGGVFFLGEFLLVSSLFYTIGRLIY